MQPKNDFSQIVKEMAAVGLQVTHLDAAEASAGNLSVFVRELTGLDPAFSVQGGEQGRYPLPANAEALVGGWLVITGTGRRLRDIASDPGSNLCVLRIEPGGETAVRYSASDVRPTSELNSHLAIHADHVGSRELSYHAIVHAQPPYLTYLSHISRYADTDSFNRRLLRWEPETILMFPDGIGMLPYRIPGSAEQMQVTLEGLRKHRAVVWQRHGVVTRSDASIQKAADLIEYAETAARYEYMNLQAGEPCSGLTNDELRNICAAFNLEPVILD